MPNWILFTQLGSYLVLIILTGLSIWSFSIMIDRYRTLRAFRLASKIGEAKALIATGAPEALVRWAKENPGSIAGRALQVALRAGSSPDAVDRSVKSYLTEERAGLEKGLTVLATLGSNAPFIGLFGTVLGIIQAFGQLSSQQANTQSVIGGISEALVATAIGLFVAIPAVVAYNVFAKDARARLIDGEIVRDLFVAFQLSEKKKG